MIKFVLLVNKQGHTRLAQYYEYKAIQERVVLESELVRRCLARSENKCNLIEFLDYKIIYRRYASLYFIIAVDDKDVNELGILEFIHALVETFDKYFDNVCELDIMFNLEKAHFILDEMIINGCIVETNKNNILYPLNVIEKTAVCKL